MKKCVFILSVALGVLSSSCSNDDVEATKSTTKIVKQEDYNMYSKDTDTLSLPGEPVPPKDKG